jgi:hypothetical protein
VADEIAACPNRRRHTRCPEGYLAWHEWAERKARTHAQERCEGCGRWAIWRRRPLTAPVEGNAADARPDAAEGHDP